MAVIKTIGDATWPLATGRITLDGVKKSLWKNDRIRRAALIGAFFSIEETARPGELKRIMEMGNDEENATLLSGIISNDMEVITLVTQNIINEKFAFKAVDLFTTFAKGKPDSAIAKSFKDIFLMYQETDLKATLVAEFSKIPAKNRNVAAQQVVSDVIGDLKHSRDFVRACVIKCPASIEIFPEFQNDGDLCLEALSVSKIQQSYFREVLNSMGDELYDDVEFMVRALSAAPILWNCSDNIRTLQKRLRIDTIEHFDAIMRANRVNSLKGFNMFVPMLDENMIDELYTRENLEKFCSYIPDVFMAPGFLSIDDEKKVILYGIRKATKNGNEIRLDRLLSKSDKEIAYALVRNNSLPFTDFAYSKKAKEQKDFEWYKNGVKKAPGRINRVPEGIFTDEQYEELYTISVEKDGMSLSGIMKRELKPNREIQEAAVKQNSMAIYYCEKAIRDKELAMLCKNAEELNCFPENVRNDPEVICHFMKYDECSIRYAGTEYLISLYHAMKGPS